MIYIYTCTDFMSSCNELRQLTSEVAKACLAKEMPGMFAMHALLEQ